MRLGRGAVGLLTTLLGAALWSVPGSAGAEPCDDDEEIGAETEGTGAPQFVIDDEVRSSTPDGVFAVSIRGGAWDADDVAFEMVVRRDQQAVVGQSSFLPYTPPRGGTVVFVPAAAMEAGERYEAEVLHNGSTVAEGLEFQIEDGTVAVDLALQLDEPTLTIGRHDTGQEVCCSNSDRCQGPRCTFESFADRPSITVGMRAPLDIGFGAPAYRSTHVEVWATAPEQDDVLVAVAFGLPVSHGLRFGHTFATRRAEYCLRADVVRLGVEGEGRVDSTQSCVADTGAVMQSGDIDVRTELSECASLVYSESGAPWPHRSDCSVNPQRSGRGWGLLMLFVVASLRGRRSATR